MNCTPTYKADRLLYIHARLANGDVLNKKELAQRFCVTERSIQRDIESLRCFITEQGLHQDILYDKKAHGYRLKRETSRMLSNSEILAVCEILLESRSMKKEEMMPILDKLLNCCVPEENRKAVTKLIANERYHYIPPRHEKKFCLACGKSGKSLNSIVLWKSNMRKLVGRL